MPIVRFYEAALSEADVLQNYNAVAGVGAHFGVGSVNFGVAGPFLIGGFLGALIGSRLGGNVGELWHRGAFATLLFGMTAYMLYQNVGSVL